VFFGPDFLTVTKAEGAEWPHLKAPILAAIMDHFTSGRPLLLDQTVESGHDEDGVYDEETSQIVAEIKDLLDTRIRPAVAADGGDIVFSKFEPATGVVWLHMRGACSGCPSSSATLKSRRREHAQALCAGSDPGRADALRAPRRCARRQRELRPGRLASAFERPYS
jgi:Fe-S cluster biogenesis protein NfuA